MNYGDYLWAVASFPSIEWDELTALLIAMQQSTQEHALATTVTSTRVL